MIETRLLWMSRIDLLGDPWELALTGDQLDLLHARRPMTPLASPPPSHTFEERTELIVKAWRAATFVNCWSATQHESHALWRIYCGSREGVAIQTTLAQLRSSVPGLEVRRVKYCEPGSTLSTPTQLQLATEKRQMFSYEQEVRVIAIDMGRREHRGFGLEWNPESVVQCICIHPDADMSFMDTVTALVRRLAPGLSGRVAWSAMTGRPAFPRT